MEISGAEHSAGRIAIRHSRLDDLPHLMAISQACGSAAHWSEQQWREIFSSQIPPRLAWMALDSSGPASAGVGFGAVGFLVAQCGGPDWELENIAVLPSFQRHGAGSLLLAALISEARAGAAERILLEVRPSNQSAVRLYSQRGFELLARRPGYYREPLEDALIMVHML